MEVTFPTLHAFCPPSLVKADNLAGTIRKPEKRNLLEFSIQMRKVQLASAALFELLDHYLNH